MTLEKFHGGSVLMATTLLFSPSGIIISSLNFGTLDFDTKLWLSEVPHISSMASGGALSEFYWTCIYPTITYFTGNSL